MSKLKPEFREAFPQHCCSTALVGIFRGFHFLHPNSLLGSKFKERPVKSLCHILHMSNSFLGKFLVYNFAGNNIITPSAAGISSCWNIKLLEYQAAGISSCWNIKLLEYQAAGI